MNHKSIRFSKETFNFYYFKITNTNCAHSLFITGHLSGKRSISFIEALINSLANPKWIHYVLSRIPCQTYHSQDKFNWSFCYSRRAAFCERVFFLWFLFFIGIFKTVEKVNRGVFCSNYKYSPVGFFCLQEPITPRQRADIIIGSTFKVKGKGNKRLQHVSNWKI